MTLQAKCHSTECVNTFAAAGSSSQSPQIRAANPTPRMRCERARAGPGVTPVSPVSGGIAKKTLGCREVLGRVDLAPT
jgi:hypothetical protein